MEQRKVLLIIVSISLVLAAIIGVGIWLFYPRDAAEPDSLAEAEGGLDWEPLDYLRGDGEVPGLDDEEPEEEDDGEFVVTYGVLEEEEGPAPPGAQAPPGTERAPERPSERVARDEPSSVVGDDEPAAQPTEAAPAREAPTAAPEAPDAAATPAAAAPAATRPPATRETPQEKPELADRAYWVQVISSPNRDTIEQAQRTLLEHQLGSRILTKEIGGTVYFRLRLGPFALREEAEKFLGWVVEIDGLADSMIFVDYTTAVIAARDR